MLSAVLILVLSVGLAVVILYKSGEMELKAAASTTAPVIERSAQETQQQKKALESIVQSQDDWWLMKARYMSTMKTQSIYCFWVLTSRAGSSSSSSSSSSSASTTTAKQCLYLMQSIYTEKY